MEVHVHHNIQQTRDYEISDTVLPNIYSVDKFISFSDWVRQLSGFNLFYILCGFATWLTSWVWTLLVHSLEMTSPASVASPRISALKNNRECFHSDRAHIKHTCCTHTRCNPTYWPLMGHTQICASSPRYNSLWRHNRVISSTHIHIWLFLDLCYPTFTI